MTPPRSLLLPVALLAGAAFAPPAVADDDLAGEGCATVLATGATITPALAELPGAAADRETAALTLTSDDPEAELRVKLRQDGGRGRRAAVRVVEVAEGEHRVTVRKPAGGDVTFATERVRAGAGRLTFRLRAVVLDAEGEAVRSHRATVQVRALREVCPDDAGTPAPAPAPEPAPEPAPVADPGDGTTTDPAPAGDAPAATTSGSGAPVRLGDDRPGRGHGGQGQGRGRGHGRP